MAITNCTECGTSVSTKASRCPKCGAPVRRSGTIGKILKGIGGLFVVTAVIGIFVQATAPRQPVVAPSASPPVSQPSQETRTEPEWMAAYHPVQMEDFRVDKKSLIGKKVRIDGLVQAVADQLFLKKTMFDMNIIHISWARLDHETQKTLLDQCQGGCYATVFATVVPTDFDIGLSAEAIQLR